MNSDTADGPPRAVLIAALVIAVGAVATILTLAAVRQRSPAPQPVAVSAIPAPLADSPDCARVIDALPGQLGDYRRSALVEPAPVGTAAWQPEDDGEPLILRCGLDRPAEFVVGAPLQVVDAVSWFRAADPTDARRATWFAVDRPVYVALTLPPGSGPDPIQTISAVLAEALPVRSPEPGPAG